MDDFILELQENLGLAKERMSSLSRQLETENISDAERELLSSRKEEIEVIVRRIAVLFHGLAHAINSLSGDH